MPHPFLDELKRAVVLRPNDVEARYQLAEAMFGGEDARGALKQLEKLLALAPEHGNGVRLMAKALEREGRLADAMHALELFVRRQPDDVAMRDELMGLCLSQGRIDDAIMQAEECLRVLAGDRRRWLQIAELYRAKRLYPQAKGALERALEIEPEDEQTRGSLRELYLEMGDEASSERIAGKRDRGHYVAQAKKAQQLPSVRQLLATAGLARAAQAVASGDFAEAKRALVQSSAEERKGAGYAFLRGELALCDGEMPQAEGAFKACVEREPSLGVAWNRLGDLMQAEGSLNDAIPYYEKALAHAPDDANGYEDLGDVYATLGNRDRAAQMYGEAAARDPKSRAKQKLKSLEKHAGVDAAPRVGRIGVLGWTPNFGGVSPLEAVAIVGKGELIFSGNVGPTGREAGLVAFSCLKARATELGIGAKVVNHDLHLHFTDTEAGKDGPSSGLALVLAGVSAYTQRKLRPLMAATGEITVFGDVKPVGGIREKVVAAKLAGLRVVLLPRKNMRDARELPTEVSDRVELIYVDTVEEAIDHAFADAATEGGGSV